MKKEERIISSMFEAAREEAPQVSFENMAKQFSKQVPTTTGAEQGGIGGIKNLLMQHISLNSILLFSVGSLALLSIILASREKEVVPLISQQEEIEIIKEKPEATLAQAISTHVLSLPPPTATDKQIAPIKIDKSVTPARSKENREPVSRLDTNQQKDKPTSAVEVEDSLEMNRDLAQRNTDSPATQANKEQRPSPPFYTPTASSEDTLKNPEETSKYLVDERGKIKDQRKVRKIDIDGTVTLTLLNSYNHDMADQFLTQLKSYGLTIKKDRYQFRRGHIRNLFVHLTHHQGLDFKLRAARFKRLDFILYFDQKDDLVGFTYHFNNEDKKGDIVSLKARGVISKSYRY